ncbi:glycosyl hydrolase 115 family protein [Prevotella sp. E13-17]|uniref:glycosyl hydrolase 115 family protein n=1 Tax=Prevotella sp. E13-17 TaxID=2913616 RepID=UPI001EDB3475|nr:glycosyl hydrolase 115 family protein [Prevotella sp. E13-17]UKK51672.1 glycosyl hydrolase 115 family protein [Prevotella sp. E13-17]
MNTRNIVLAILTLCIPILGGGLAAKKVADTPTEIRTIKTFREYKTKNGTSLTINNKAYSEPDIYYTENGDGTYDAIRLTVTPIEVPAEMTAPYLNQATDHSIQVCWKTKAINNNSIVKYGTDANHLDKQVSSSARQIATSYYWYNAQIEGLSPNTVYYYQVICGEKSSEIHHFRTMPEPTSLKPFRILMIGDHQRNERSDYEWLIRMAARKAQQKWGKENLEDNVSMIMNVGDQVDSGSIRQYEFTHLYKSREVMSKLPIMTCVGNHELFKDPELKLYDGHYASYGNMDYQGIKSYTAFYYAYQAGPVLFIVLNTDGVSEQQKQWAKRVVEAADKDASVRFIISVQHRPLYAEQWASDTNPWMTNEIMPILSSSKKHVLNCAGHHHLYARGQMQEWPVYHMITGGGVGTSAQDYEQLWGKTPDNRNRDEVQKTIDQWTYQLMEFNPSNDEVTIETYSIGNSRLALDNVLIDRFSRKLSQTDKPATPSLYLSSTEVTLPATIQQQATVEGLHSSEYQIARDAKFTDIVYQRTLLFEDYYDVDNTFMPKNVRNGQPVTTLELTKKDLPSGHFFMRCRNRSMNLDWSDYSESKVIDVSGSTAPQLILDNPKYEPGATININYQNAPVGTQAWIGIYLKGQQPGPGTPSYAWQYTTNNNGTIQFNIKDVNDYYAVLFADNGYTEISPRVTFSVKNAIEGLTLAKGNVTIIVPEEECSQVKLAVEALQRDFEKVLGFRPEIASTAGQTSGVELLVANMSTKGVEQLLPEAKETDGYESHRVYADADNHRIVMQGADMRGTIYAIYTLSEKILGVPPLWYWCDWKPEQQTQIEVSDDLDYYVSSPTVRYRAWFPNDEDLFVPWRRLSTDNNERWLETMLRLKLNTVEYTATVTTNGTLNSEAMLYKKYGLVLTSHHMVALNNSFANWDAYWQQVRKTTPPALSVNDMASLREFWQYNINSVMNSGVENLWQVAFRGKTDQPFWSVFTDAPSSDAERGAVINRMVKEQYDMICQATGEANPFVRMTFYDEISSLLAAGHLQPPTATNMLWTFVAGRRDHYPYDDLVNWTNVNNVKLGYYMNLQFYSTGAHLAPAEGPWKMEDNYRYVQSKGPLTFSVVNAGNVREFLMEMSANAAMMWNSNSYNTNDFMRQFCAQYFGEEHADEIAQLYHDYYYAYWNPKKSDFPGGFDRQYVFQDLRHSQVIKQINNTWNTFKSNPFTEIGYESVAGRTFRIEGRNPVDSVLAGMSREMKAFAEVARHCEAIQSKLPSDRQTFFYDHLSAYAHYMENLSTAVYHFVYAYKNKEDRYSHLATSYEAMKAAKAALIASQHGVFSNWYDTDDKFEMDARIEAIRGRMAEAEDLTLTEQLIENNDFEYNNNCQLNAKGNIGRGIPCNWLSKGELKKGANGLDSYGVNQDATNLHGNNVCWINSVPMPDEFWLYQTIPASKLEPGEYLVACKLWVESNKKTNCRLFANQNVQYYGTAADYTNLLTEGEINTYAGYAGGSSSNVVLRDMEVKVNVKAGEDLTIGIKTGNKRNNGERSTSDNAGWFKVDFFRIHHLTGTDNLNHTLTTTKQEDKIYSLTGQHLSQPNKGINIINHKKVMIK